MEKRKLNTRTIVMVAMLGALAGVLMLLEIPVPFTLPFIKFDFSDLPVLISGFLFGPLLGVVTAVVKILIKIVLKPTSTMYVGELSNLILCITFTVVASLIYRMNRTKKGAVIGLVSSTLVTSIIAIASNMLFIFPFYVKMFHLPMAQIVAMTTQVSPWVKTELQMFLLSVFPFNIFKYGVISIITFLIYKKISIILKKYTRD